MYETFIFDFESIILGQKYVHSTLLLRILFHQLLSFIHTYDRFQNYYSA